MHKVMISRIGRSLPRFLVGAHVAGEGVQERLRSATFALFGLVTAIGLVLVGISYNQGWPDFVDSPIPGIRTERVGEASIVAGAVQAKAHPGKSLSESVPKSPRSSPAGPSDSVLGVSSAPHVSSQQQAPGTGPVGHVPDPAPSGQGGADAPATPVPAPIASAPQAAAQPPPTASTSPAPQTAKEATPVATSPPASKQAATVPGNGKAKGHEKRSTAPAPVVPKAPSVPPQAPAPKAPPTPPTPPAPTVPPKEAPPPASEQPGKGLAKGHYK